MIQLNLLPEVKKEYIKAKRTKRMIMSISTIVGVASIILLVLVFSYVQIAQKKSINDLTKDIEQEVASIQSTEGLDEILTIQNQLNTLPGLFLTRPETSRVIDYTRKVVPEGVYISELKVDVINSTMEISGESDNLTLINKFADTLKFATYNSGDIKDVKPFSNITTDSFRVNERTSYTVKLEYDPVLLDNTQDIVLVVPNTITTRSVTGQPELDPLFIEKQESGEQQ